MEKIEEQLALGNRIHESVVAPEAAAVEPLVMFPEDEVNVEAAAALDTPTVTDPVGVTTVVTLSDKAREALKEALPLLTKNPNVQAGLATQGLTIDYKAVQDMIESEDSICDCATCTEEPVACACTTCACTTCVEGSHDTDLEQIVADMSERLAKLEERIALYNGKAAHKI